jgi:hypothetical protein
VLLVEDDKQVGEFIVAGWLLRATPVSTHLMGRSVKSFRATYDVMVVDRRCPG